MKIYTKTGDDGTTGLIGGSRTAKASDRIAAIGEVDELNSSLGVARTCVTQETADLEAMLSRVQSQLFDLGAELASPHDGPRQHRALRMDHVSIFEESIDTLTSELPPLTQFILPGGSALGAALHHSRCVCRRAERAVLRLVDTSEEAKAYLNRLSDWLFVAARTANARHGVPDVVWEKTL